MGMYSWPVVELDGSVLTNSDLLCRCEGSVFAAGAAVNCYLIAGPSFQHYDLIVQVNTRSSKS